MTDDFSLVIYARLFQSFRPREPHLFLTFNCKLTFKSTTNGKEQVLTLHFFSFQ